MRKVNNPEGLMSAFENLVRE